jgi:ketosteroid isomerase-like protein
MNNSELIKQFYASFAEKNSEGMIGCYHPNIVFEDPAFGKLEGERAKNMWRMLIANNKGGIKITYSEIVADEKTGSANWMAEYVFGQTGRNVVNKISAKFEFKDNKIIKHTDSFSLYTWAKQAMGLNGYLIGWTSFFQKKLQKKTNSLLDNYTAKLKQK